MATRTNSKARRTDRSPLIAASLLLGAVIVAVSFQLRPAPADSAADSQAPVVVGEFDVVSVPVPTEPVTAGKRVKDIRFRLVSFPRQQVPVGALTDLSEIQNYSAASSLPANLPLFRENFLSSGMGGINPVIESIPQGMRAMTVRVDATTAVEGWAGSGSVVDVLLVEKDRTSVVAEKIKVLSAERSVSPVEGAAAPSVPTTVTLLVTQEQCLAINTAIPRGKMAFALRSVRDEDKWTDTVFTADNLKTLNTEERRAQISGVVSVKNKAGQTGASTFALTDGRWTKTSVIPEGFGVKHDVDSSEASGSSAKAGLKLQKIQKGQIVDMGDPSAQAAKR